MITREVEGAGFCCFFPSTVRNWFIINENLISFVLSQILSIAPKHEFSSKAAAMLFSQTDGEFSPDVQDTSKPLNFASVFPTSYFHIK